jgi:hypothetical protein
VSILTLKNTHTIQILHNINNMDMKRHIYHGHVGGHVLLVRLKIGRYE